METSFSQPLFFGSYIVFLRVQQFQLFRPGQPLEMPFAAHGLRLRLKALAIDQLNREAAAGVLPAAAGVMAAKTALKIVGPAGVEPPVTAAQHAAGNPHRAKPCYDQ